MDCHNQYRNNQGLNKYRNKKEGTKLYHLTMPSQELMRRCSHPPLCFLVFSLKRDIELEKNILCGENRVQETRKERCGRCGLPLKSLRVACTQNRLWTTNRFAKRGWQNYGVCPLCMRSVVSVDHLLVQCRYTIRLWASSMIGSAFNPSTFTFGHQNHCRIGGLI